MKSLHGSRFKKASRSVIYEHKGSFIDSSKCYMKGSYTCTANMVCWREGKQCSSWYILGIACIGPATRCDAAHLQWDVLKPLRCIKNAFNVLQCIFQHVGNFTPDFRISQLFIVRFSNSLHLCDDHLISLHMMHGPKF